MPCLTNKIKNYKTNYQQDKDHKLFLHIVIYYIRLTERLV